MATPYDDFLPALPLPPMYDAAAVRRLENAARAPFRARRRDRTAVSDGPAPALPPIHSFVTPRAGQSLGDLGSRMFAVGLERAIQGQTGAVSASPPRGALLGKGPSNFGLSPSGNRNTARTPTNSQPGPAHPTTALIPGSGPSSPLAGRPTGKTPAPDLRAPTASTNGSHSKTGSRALGAPAKGSPSAGANGTATTLREILDNPTVRTGLSLLGLENNVRQMADIIAKANPNDPKGFRKAWRKAKAEIIAGVPEGAKAAAKKTCADCERDHAEKLKQERDAAVMKTIGAEADWYANLATARDVAENRTDAKSARAPSSRYSDMKAKLESDVQARTARSTGPTTSPPEKAVGQPLRAEDEVTDTRSVRGNNVPSNAGGNGSSTENRDLTASKSAKIEAVADNEPQRKTQNGYVKGAILERRQIPRGALFGPHGRVMFLMPSSPGVIERRFVNGRLLKDGRVKVISVAEASIGPRGDELVAREVLRRMNIPNHLITNSLVYSTANILAAIRDPFREDPRTQKEQVEEDGVAWTGVRNLIRALQSSDSAASALAGEIYEATGASKFLSKSKKTFIHDFSNVMAITSMRFVPRGASLFSLKIHPADEAVEKLLKRIRKIEPSFEYSPRGHGYQDFDVDFLREHWNRLKSGNFKPHRGPGVIKRGKVTEAKDPDTWFEMMKTEGVRLPRRIQKSLHGIAVRDTRQLTREIWKAIANDRKYSKVFTKAQLKEMKKGNPPPAPKNAQYGQLKSFVVHHIYPKQGGGAPFDLSNIAIVTPRHHREILPRKVHNGRKFWRFK